MKSAVCAITASLLVPALVAVGSAESSTRAAAGKTDTVYRLAATVSCLKGRGLAIRTIDPADRRLRAMRDLAQKTSRQARSGKSVVAFVVGRSASNATLLVELLTVPKDPYRLERKDNVVLLYKPTAVGLRSTVLACLR